MPSSNPKRLSISRILAWADAHHRRQGCWPSVRSGAVAGSRGETWSGIEQALARGYRGLPGGDSLSRLLARRRGQCAADRAPRLSRKQILAWADDHHRSTGHWPQVKSGKIAAAPAENWKRIDNALLWGLRGLPAGSSLARLLDRHRYVRNRKNAPPLFVRDILIWVDAHHRRTGKWPKPESGPVVDALDETWAGISGALWQGTRGLPGGSTLPRFLAHYRGVRNRRSAPRLSAAEILHWADAHMRRTGRRPTVRSGPIRECPGETWCSVDKALQRGKRGFRAKSSLSRFLDQHNRVNSRTWRRLRTTRFRVPG